MNLRRVTGLLLVGAPLAFAAATSVLSATFGWPDILREPAATVLAATERGGTALTWTWFATAWTYALLGVPMLLLPAALGRRGDPVLQAATAVGAASVLLSLTGFLRWVFVVPGLARAWSEGDAPTRAATEAAWTAQRQFGGALQGEHLGQILAIAWSVTICAVALRRRLLPTGVGVTGVGASALYLLNQGDVLATGFPGFPVWDAAGFVGSTAWGVWVAALGVALLLPFGKPVDFGVPEPPARSGLAVGH